MGNAPGTEDGGLRAVRHNRCYAPVVDQAHLLGFSHQGLRHLRSLIEERGRNSWAVGDILVSVYGRPPLPGVMDGSRLKMTALAEEFGVSMSWLIQVRRTAAAWPRKERRSAPFPVFVHLAARAGRVLILDMFLDECQQTNVTPSLDGLKAWLADPPHQHGRRRLDPVDKVERLALALPREELAQLVERLQAALVAVAAA